MSKVFCPHCGNQTLKKVAVTLSDDGSLHMHFSKNPKVLNPRGLRVRHTNIHTYILLDCLCCDLLLRLRVLFVVLFSSTWRCSTRCRSHKAVNTAATRTWWRTSASPSRDCRAKLARRRTSSIRTTWREGRLSARTTSTAAPPTCRSETASVVAAGGGPTPTPPAGSSSRRSEASTLVGLI